MNSLRRLLEDFKKGENIDVYVTIAIGIVASILAATQGLGLIAGLTLVALSFLAYNMVGSRHQIQELQSLIKESVNDILLPEFPASLNSDIDRADELWLVGVTLSRTIKTHYPKLEEKLRKGHSVKVLLVDANDVTKGYVAHTPRQEVEQRARYIDDVLKSLKDLSTIKDAKLQVRLTATPLTFGATGVQLDSMNINDGVIYIEYYTFRRQSDGKPKLVLRTKDSPWFEFFKHEIQAKWNEAKPYSFE